MDDLATSTFKRTVLENPYPGRGLVVGRNAQSEWTLIYWIMGRSEHSRNRQFVAESGVLRTRAFDPSKVADPSLIIYEAMLELPGVQLVSNGDQTRTIHDALARGSSFQAALSERRHEPDAPHFTPRISAMLDLRGAEPQLLMSVLRANPLDSSSTDRTLFSVAAPPAGIGRALTTYRGDGNPLPTFEGEPLVLPCNGGAADLLEMYWSALHPDNRIALAVKTLRKDGGTRELLIRNRHV
jgi:IMP cyclohydrolase